VLVPHCIINQILQEKFVKKSIFLIAPLLLLISPSAHSNSIKNIKKPKLIVMLVIDQFRADYLTRFKDRFLPAKNSAGAVGGFSYLMSEGAYFPYAQYDVLQAMTGPGHATVLTGSYPYQSGIPINDWYDSKTGKNVYCVEDENTSIVGIQKDEPGMSPKNLIGSTVGDELKNAGYPSKVISIALKDRAAILMGGHRADLALWFDPKSFQWISSSYYLPEKKLPEWTEKLNQEIKIKKAPIKIWSAKLQETLKTYLVTTSTYPENKLIGKIGPTFNHGIEACSPEELSSPYGIELTTQAALRAVDSYQLGKNKTPDLLAISFSSHDYVGHAFGPNSKEIEDMTVSEDRSISLLLNALKTKIPGGLDEVVVILTADHGVSPNADWLAKNKIDSANISSKGLNKTINEALDKKFGSTNGQWLSYEVDFNYYIDRKSLENKKADIDEVESEIKRILLQEKGIAHAFTKNEYEKRLLPPGIHQRQILKTYYAGRSGDVVAIPKPFFFQSDSTTTHMTGYSYDSTVPLIIKGAAFKSGIIPKIVEVVDIAPTLTILNGTIPPSSSEGRVLTEAFK
jgi:predicted AlkP superfamily pyrophosphatase or phosphodiesterase